MASKRIAFQLQGMESDNGDVQFDEFIKQLTYVEKSLNEVDKAVTRSPTETLFYRVVNLSHNSPAIIELEAIPLTEDNDTSELVVDRFISGLSQIYQEGTAPEDFDYEVLESFSSLTGLLGKTIRELTISTNGTKLPITTPISSTVNGILGTDVFEHGSVTGMLDHLNLHGDQPVFTVYPTLGGKLRCIIRKSQKSLVVQAAGKYVTVYGRMRYRSRSTKPYEMNVEEIEIHPSEEDLPTLSELRGIAPDALDGQTTEKFLWEIRNEWE